MSKMSNSVGYNPTLFEYFGQYWGVIKKGTVLVLCTAAVVVGVKKIAPEDGDPYVQGVAAAVVGIVIGTSVGNLLTNKKIKVI